MSYVPTPEKLESLGFKGERAGYTWHMNGHWLNVYADEISLDMDSGCCNIPLFVKCPSEAFFDQLLIAVGWNNER